MLPFCSTFHSTSLFSIFEGRKEKKNKDNNAERARFEQVWKINNIKRIERWNRPVNNVWKIESIIIRFDC